MAFEVRDRQTGEVAYYYPGPRQEFGGPWGDSNQFLQMEVPERPPVAPDPSEAQKARLKAKAASGTLTAAEIQEALRLLL